MNRKLGWLVGGSLLLLASGATAQEMMTLARACGNDIDRLCAGVPPGEGRIKACIKAHMAELSAPCFDAILKAIAAEKEPE
ncbi:MAG: cysteine rich repeat-containing protein [Dongiaceae bacterium]